MVSYNYYCSNTRGRFLRASVFKELLELLCKISVANQFHLCIAKVANKIFCCKLFLAPNTLDLTFCMKQ